MPNIAKFKEEVYRNDYAPNSAFWSQGQIDLRFKVGDQALWDDALGTSNYRSRYNFFFNFLRRQVNLVGGHFRRTRKSIIATPQKDEAEQDSSDMTALLLYEWNKGNWHETISQCFESSVTVGQDFLHLYKTTLFDRTSGNLALDKVGFQNVLIDPFYKKLDMSDCQYAWIRKWVSKNQAKTMIPFDHEMIDSLRPGKGQDGKFPYQSMILGRSIQFLHALDIFYYREFRDAYFVVDLLTGQTKEWPGTKRDLDEFIGPRPWLNAFKTEVPTVKLNLAIDGKEIYDGENELGIDRYPIVPFWCYREPELTTNTWRTQGIIRNLRDVQFLYNRRKIIEFDLLESQVNSGFIYKPEDLVNPKEVFQTGNGRGIALKKQADGSSLQKIPPNEVPQSVIELSRLLQSDMLQISGINEELLGADTDDKAGILSQLRQSSAMTTLQIIFDQADFSQKVLGEITSESIQKNYTSRKVADILGHQPSPTFFDPDTTRYGISIEDGVYSSTQRQQALRMGAYLRETLQIPIPNEFFIQNANLPKKTEMLEEIAQQEQQQQQMQQQAMMAEQQKEQVDAQHTQSQTASNLALAGVRQAQAAQIESNIDKNEIDADESAARSLKILSEISQNLGTPMEVL
jgi:hypothetical protein